MADPQVRPAGGGLSETLLHLTCATTTIVIVYLLAGFVGDAAVAATRYLSG